jgi:ribonuclease Z
MKTFNITGYSTALFSTWYFIEELGLLFDAGDGVNAGLLQKMGKIENVFISHADRDHLMGLLQLRLNTKADSNIYYPKDCGSFPALDTFAQKFDPHILNNTWHGIKEDDVLKIKENTFVQAIRNNHVVAEPHISKSLGYQVFETKSKLKAEYLHLSQPELLKLIQEKGKENLTNILRTNLVTYTGDTPVDDYEKWNHTQILIHEATFLSNAEESNINFHGNKHSTLEDVLKMVAELNVETLILGHFSSRYSKEEIDEKIKFYCKEFKVKIPVFRVLPGLLHRNILEEETIN